MDFHGSSPLHLYYMLKYHSHKMPIRKATTMQRYEYVKSLRLAGWLMYHGFRILRIESNNKVVGKDVYVFKQSDELSDCIFEYIDTRTKDKKHDANERSGSKGQ